MFYATGSKVVKVEDGVGATLKHFVLEIDTPILAVAREEAVAWAKREELKLDSVRRFNNEKMNRSNKWNKKEFSDEYYESMVD